MIKVLNEHGEDFFPATTTDAVGHNQGECSLTDLVDDYNVSTIWPLSEGHYTLTTAIAILDQKLLGEQKRPGVRAGFINSSGVFEEWEYFAGGYNFSNELGWRRTDSSVLLELQAAVFPLSSTFSVSPTLIQTGKSTSVTLSWKVTRKGLDVTGAAKKYLNSEPISTMNTTITINEPLHTTKTYTFTGSYDGLTTTASKTITVNDLSYYGAVGEGWLPNPAGLSSFTSTLQSGKGFTWNNINLNYQKMVYAYPQYFGALTSIKDANNFEYINSYTRYSVTLGSVDYYVYVLNNPTTITDAKQTYS